MKRPSGWCARVALPVAAINGFVNFGAALAFLMLATVAFPVMAIAFVPALFCLGAACLFYQCASFLLRLPALVPPKPLFLYLGIYQLGVAFALAAVGGYAWSIGQREAGGMAFVPGLWPLGGAAIFGRVWWRCRAAYKPPCFQIESTSRRHI